MKLAYTDTGDAVVLILDKKEGQTFIEIIGAAQTGKPLNKRSKAFRLAKLIDDELPVF